MRVFFEKFNQRSCRLWAIVAAVVLALIIFWVGLSQVSALRKRAQSTPAPIVSTSQTRRRVVVIVHGTSTSKFWPKVKLGAEQAAKDYGMEVEFIRLAKSSDFVEMSSLIEQAIASKPDGMAISVPDKKALEPAIHKIVEAKIPFIIINAGQHDARELGALTYIGQLDYAAGRQAGLRMAELGVRRAFCISHDPKNVAVRDRCEGFKESLLLAGGQAQILVVDRNQPDEMKTRIKDLLTLFPETDGLLTTADMPFVLEALEELGKAGQIKLGGFDFSPETLKSIMDGKVLFAIDQQPYLQGYLPITFFNLLFANANTISQDEVATGPNFITAENAALVESLSAAGTR